MTFSLRSLKAAVCASLVVLLGGGAALAQNEPVIDIVGGQSEPMPVALPTFMGSTPETAEAGAALSEVIENNLKRSGLFAPIDQRAFIQRLDT
ncbi:MAG: Tol-Pal system protein TolB, partial [Pseudomonadota bacterium]